MNEREHRDQDRRGMEGEEFMKEEEELREPDPDIRPEEDPGIERTVL